MNGEPLLDAGDIQGHVFPGYPRADLRLMAVRAADRGALQEVMRRTFGPDMERLTLMRDAFVTRSAVKRHLMQGAPEPEQPLRFNVGFTRQGLDLLGFADIKGVDRAFDAGMTGNSTGDPKDVMREDGTQEPAHPQHWVVGGRNAPFHALLLFACAHDILSRTAVIADTVRSSPGIAVEYEELGRNLPGDIEHFGFVDGISSPGLYGNYRDAGGAIQPLTTRYGVPSVHGLDFGKPGQPLVWPGRFIVGAPSFEGDAGETVHDVFRNGSFLVFRRLQQDVHAFRADTDALAAQVASGAGLPSFSGERLRELMVGRRRDGHPLMRDTAHRMPATGPQLADNHFSYGNQTPGIDLPGIGHIPGAAADPAGARCPLWAHIRKVNPRDGMNDLNEEAHNLQPLRRGVPFGQLYREDEPPSSPHNATSRGLLFLSYQRSVHDQFENLNSHWMNRFDVPGGGGHDLLVGLALSLEGRLTERRAVHVPTGQPVIAARNWVVPTGGAYLFAPGLKALQQILGA